MKLSLAVLKLGLVALSSSFLALNLGLVALKLSLGLLELGLEHLKLCLVGLGGVKRDWLRLIALITNVN